MLQGRKALSPGVHVQKARAWGEWRGGGETFSLPSDPAASILALAPREGRESAAGQDWLPNPGAHRPVPLPRTSTPHLRQRTVRQRHRVAARHQSAATLRAPGSAAAWRLLRPAGREGEGEGRLSALAHPPLAEQFAPPDTEQVEQGQCPLLSPYSGWACGRWCRGHLGRTRSPHISADDGGQLGEDRVLVSQARA